MIITRSFLNFVLFGIAIFFSGRIAQLTFDDVNIHILRRYMPSNASNVWLHLIHLNDINKDTLWKFSLTSRGLLQLGTFLSTSWFNIVVNTFDTSSTAFAVQFAGDMLTLSLIGIFEMRDHLLSTLKGLIFCIVLDTVHLIHYLVQIFWLIVIFCLLLFIFISSDYLYFHLVPLLFEGCRGAVWLRLHSETYPPWRLLIIEAHTKT